MLIQNRLFHGILFFVLFCFLFALYSSKMSSSIKEHRLAATNNLMLELQNVKLHDELGKRVTDALIGVLKNDNEVCEIRISAAKCLALLYPKVQQEQTNRILPLFAVYSTTNVRELHETLKNIMKKIVTDTKMSPFYDPEDPEYLDETGVASELEFLDGYTDFVADIHKEMGKKWA